MLHIVTTRDQIQFTVESDARTAKFDQAYAAERTAEELAANPDFVRIRSLDDIFGPLLPQVPLLAGPPTPAQRRAAFRVIQGGKS